MADGGQVLVEGEGVGLTRIPPRARLMLEGPVLPVLLRLSAPNLAEAAARIGFIAADAVFIGWLGPEALAGVSLVFPLLLLVQMVSASGFGTGVAAAVARSLGAGDREAADALAAQALWLAMAAWLASAAVMLPAGPFLWAALGATGPALEAANAYSTLVFAGIGLVWLMNLLANAVRGTGAMAVSAGAIVAGEAVHLLLSPALILGWGPFPAMGVQGAAIGVLAAYGTGAAVLLAWLCSPQAGARLRHGALAPRLAAMRGVLRVGLLAVLTILLLQATAMAATALVAGFGAAVLAGYGAAQRLELLQLPITFAFGSAVIALVAANLGAGLGERALAAARAGALLAGGIGLGFGAVALLLPGAWMRLFLADAEAVGAGVLYLRLIGPAMPLLGLALGLSFALLGAGRAGLPAGAGALRLLILAGGGGLALAAGAGLPGLFLAVAAGMAGFALPLLLFGSRIMRRLTEGR